MNIIQKIKHNHKQKIRSNLLSDLYFFHFSEWNDGLSKKRLTSIRDVRGFTYQSGGYSFLTVRMSDGYEVFVSGVFFEDTVKKAVNRIVERLCEVYGLDKIDLEPYK